MRRIARALYLTSLILLPLTWFPPFPWLHEHAQWSDAVFLAAAIAWLIERFQLRRWAPFTPFHAALLLYFPLPSRYLVFAAPNPRPVLPKLHGVAQLCALVLMASDRVWRSDVCPGIARA